MNSKLDILKNNFGYAAFRRGQEEAIDAILAGRDVLAVMPTGAGKSLCYQIPAMLLSGMTIVISPLISLMKDQVSALRETGIAAAFLNSSQSAGEYAAVMKDILNGGIKLLYAAPERLPRIQSFAANISIPLVVVDEAHCVSQWGHDFRTSYLQIADFIDNLETRPVSAAFTATATEKVRGDIQRLLALRNPLAVNTGFDRPNLYFEVQKPRDKNDALLDFLSARKNESGIIYCATRKAVDEVRDLLARNGFSATRYHAGLDDGERRINQDDFIYDRKPIIVATNAFGMGINKSNVAFVVHYNMPKNIESYYQEAGRAGRDGSRADCVLLYSGRDVRINEFLITRTDDDEVMDARLELHNRELLKQMTFYATSADCLRRRLLAYFGEQSPPECGNCSNCRAEYEETDITLAAQKIISCVYRLKERGRSFGKTMIIDILRGSKTEKIRRFSFDSLSVWGIMKDTDAREIRALLDSLIEARYLKLEGGEYPVVTLERTAEDALRGDARVFVKLRKERQYLAREKQNAETERGKSAGSRRKTPDIPPAEIDRGLFEKLRTARGALAAKEAVPAYIVFSDAALRDMCRKRPVSRADFSAVNGVGEVKLEKYGDFFTALIREHIESGMGK